MSEPTIIDGVDVSKCCYCVASELRKDYINKFGCFSCKESLTPYILCEDNSNCYFKQLQRLKAENELLKKEVETWKYQTEKRAEIGEAWFEVSQKFKTALESRKAENEKLKEQKNEYYQNNLTYERQISELIEVLEYISKMLLGHKIADEVRIKSILYKIDEVLKCG